MKNSFKELKESLFRECYESRLSMEHFMSVKETVRFREEYAINSSLMRIFLDCGLYEEYREYEIQKSIHEK